MEKAKKAPSQVLKLTVILFLVSAITSGVLGFTNQLTEERIAEQKRLKTAMAYNAVLPYDGDYTPVEDFDSEMYPTVDSISKAGDAGYVVELTFSGAQGSITAAVGVDNNNTVTGVSIIGHSETPSLGARITEDSFRDMFVGETEGVALTKSGGNIEAITSATISSQAVVDAVNTAIEVVKDLG